MIRNNKKEKSKQTSTKVDEKNNLLVQFVNELNEANRNNKQTLDIRHIMTNAEKYRFDLLEGVITELFSAENLMAGIEKVINNKPLSSPDQVSVLLFLKMFETFVELMNKKTNNETDEVYAPFDSNVDEMYA